MRFKSLISCCVFALATALLSACIKVDQDLVLNGDGTGTFHVRYGMKTETIAQIEAMAKEGQPGDSPAQMPFHFDEAKVRKDFEVYAKDGVTLESFKSEVIDGWKFIELRMKFATLEGLGKTEFLADRKLVLKHEGDRYVLEQRPDSPHVPEKNADAPEVQDMMAAMMKGFHAGMSVQVPGDVVECNGTQDGRKVSWVFDLEKDPQALKKAQQLNMKVAFKGDGLKL